MTKRIRDEFVEHHEGQAIFTARRVIFGAILFAACAAVTTWILLSRERM